MIDHDVYALFYDDKSSGKAFLHSHTYSGNPLAVSAALATIHTMRAEGINQQAEALGACMRGYFSDIATQTGRLSNVRSIGALVAADLTEHESPRMGHLIASAALRRGALLRPIGNTVYWLPPLNTDHQTIEALADITFSSLRAVYRGEK